MYRLRILVNGNPVPIYRDYASGTDWIEARNGTRYEIEVRNDSYNRILSVVSVDGLNVINGKHEDPLSAPGYILHSHNNIKIPGWKISSDDVKEFYFTPQGQSYSAKLGADLSNTGVIAAAIYKEKITWTYTTSYYPQPWVYPTIKSIQPQWVNDNTLYSSSGSSSGGILRSSLSSDVPVTAFAMSSAPIQEPKLGTGSGVVADFKTHTTSFGERQLETILILYYGTKEELLRRGIKLQPEGLPRPFSNGTGYCPNV
jgi:hypothetical protein